MPDIKESNMTSTQKSKTAIVLTLIYLLLVLGAFAMMLMAKPGESLSGIFVLLVAMPWSMLLTWFTDTPGIDSIVINTIFLALCCILNAVIIHFMISFIARRFSGKV